MALVLITGVSGFVGSHVAKAAQDAGYRVRGTVRKADAYREILDGIAPGITLVEVDLVTSTVEEIAAAAEGCEYCCHVASPFPLSTPKDENDLIVPAVEGTLKVLKACKVANIKRVVVTSSIVAVSSGHDKTCFTSEDWSVIDKCGAHSKSKTLAELAARKFASENELELTTVNPSYVQGPVLFRRECSSTKLATRLLGGEMPAVPAIGLNVCDVRDVAEAHIKALATKEFGGRFIVCGGGLLTTEIVPTFKAEFPLYPVKTLPAAEGVVWLYSFLDKEVANVLPLWKRRTVYGTTEAEVLLGRRLRLPIDACMAMARSVDEFGLAKGKKSETSPIAPAC